MSLIAILGISAMTVVPGSGAESWRSQMILVAGIFFIGWLCLTFWARPRERVVSPPQWLRGLFVLAGVIYMLGILFFVIA
jgi:hypothetical protein